MKIFKKEKEVTELAERYLDVAELCVVEAKKAVMDCLESQCPDMLERALLVSGHEHEADELRREMRDKLFSGAFLPLMRADIASLFESIDRVPNAAEACTKFFYGERPNVPDELRARFRAIASESFDVIKPLTQAGLGFFRAKGKVDAIREAARQIGVEEARVDALELSLTAAIFESTSLSLAEKNHLRRSLSKIVEIADRAEDAADTLLLIALKSIA